MRDFYRAMRPSHKRAMMVGWGLGFAVTSLIDAVFANNNIARAIEAFTVVLMLGFAWLCARMVPDEIKRERSLDRSIILTETAAAIDHAVAEAADRFTGRMASTRPVGRNRMEGLL